MDIVEIIKNCDYISEYIVNCYIYCFNNSSQLLNAINNKGLFISKQSDNLLKEIHESKKKTLDFFKQKTLEDNPEKILINLIAIDDLIPSLDLGNEFFNSNSIKCGFDEYVILKKPVNPIYDFLQKGEKALRKPEEVSKHLNHCFKNFMISSKKIEGFNCEIKHLDDIEPITNSLLKEFKNISFGVFSNISIPNYDEKIFENNDSDIVLKYFPNINNEQQICDEIEKILKLSYEQNISIILLPELFVYPISRKFISNWLKENNDPEKIIMVIAGSMSIFDSSNNQCRNESVIYNFCGQIIHTQNKIQSFTNTDKSDIFKEYINYDKSKFVCIESSLGRFSISICLDFIDIEELYLRMNKEYSVNINFVPAMSNKLGDFDLKAKKQGRDISASTLCANTILSPENTNKGFIYIPIASLSKSIKYISSLDNGLFYTKVKLYDLLIS